MTEFHTSRAAFSVPEIMVQIGLSRDGVYGLIRDGKLKARKIGRRTLVTSTDLQEFLQALPTLGRDAKTSSWASGVAERDAA